MNTVQSFEDEFGEKDISSPIMQQAVSEWFNLYYDAEMASENSDSSQRIPCVVVSEVYNAVFGEYESSVDDETMGSVIDNIDAIKDDIFQETLVGGEGFIKPIPKDNGFVFSFINRNSYVVLAKDEEGNVTSIGMSEKTIRGKYYYTLLERRTVADGKLVIECQVFKSHDRDTLGERGVLDEIYPGLQPESTLEINNLGLIPVKLPIKNCVDGSEDGVSIYAMAVKEIRKLYKHDARTEDEYELTAPHLVASIDVQRRNKKGELVEIPKYITALDEDNSDVGLTIYNPTPNQQELEARENQILRSIENLVNLRRGILSHVETDDRTATEVATSSARYALLIKKLQGMWSEMLGTAMEICAQLGQIYLNWGNKELPEVVVSWGNGVLYDEDKEYNRLYQLVAGGHLKPEYLIKWMEIHKMEEKEIAEIRQAFMPMDSEFGNRLFPEGEDGI